MAVLKWIYNEQSDYPWEAWIDPFNNNGLLSNKSALNTSSIDKKLYGVFEVVRELTIKSRELADSPDIPIAFLSTEANEWLNNNMKSKWKYDDNMVIIRFSDPDDATLFRLSW